MTKINIGEQKETPTSWEFLVEVEGEKFLVTVSKDYHQKLTKGKLTAGELVRKSFLFLLEREPVTSILKKFNLKVINQYFPEYEREISTNNS
jgi:hypothetical protein